MSYKTILVCLSSKEEAERLVPIASLLARKFGAHLIGIHCIQNVDMPATVSVQLSGSALSEMHTLQEKQANDIKIIFEQLTRNDEFVCEWRQIETTQAGIGERLAEQARCSDLVVMTQVDPENGRATSNTIQRHIIENSGRPVLVIPCYGYFEHIGERPLIGWSGTGECTRAVHDAIPFLQTGKETQICWISGSDDVSNQKLTGSSHEIAAALNRHNVKAAVAHRNKTDIPIGDELLNEASDAGSDLIVTGAYGHSRLYDFVIGATTSHLLKYMTIPVLFAH